jgi:predicted MFS family arabinose efflux permease
VTRFRVLVFAAGFAMGMTAPFELIYAERFGVGAAGIGAFLLTTSVAMCAVDLLGTRVVPQLDARRMLVVGTAGFAVASVILGAAPGFGVLLAGRVVQGAGAGIILGAGLQAAVRIDPSEARALGMFNACFLGGTALGSPVGGAMADAISGTAGFRATFLACGAVSAVVALAVRVRLDPLPSPRPGRPRLSLPNIGGSRGIGAALVLAALGDFVRGGVIYTTLPLAGTDRGLSPLAIGVAVGLLSALEIVVLTVAARVFERLGLGRCLVGALGIGVLSAVVLAVTTGPVAYFGGALVFGLVVAVATVGPPLVILALSDDPAAGLAQFRISSGLGMLIGFTGGGVLVTAAGPTVAFSAVAAILVAGMVLARVSTDRLQRRQIDLSASLPAASLPSPGFDGRGTAPAAARPSRAGQDGTIPPAPRPGWPPVGPAGREPGRAGKSPAAARPSSEGQDGRSETIEAAQLSGNGVVAAGTSTRDWMADEELREAT